MLALGAWKLPVATNSSRSLRKVMNFSSVETTAAAGRGTDANWLANSGASRKAGRRTSQKSISLPVSP